MKRKRPEKEHKIKRKQFFVKESAYYDLNGRYISNIVLPGCDRRGNTTASKNSEYEHENLQDPTLSAELDLRECTDYDDGPDNLADALENDMDKYETEKHSLPPEDPRIVSSDANFQNSNLTSTPINFSAKKKLCSR